MKLGIITDIHNNLTALEAAAEQLSRLGCEQFICCGDIIGIGPQPEETVQYIRQLPRLLAVRGNHENYLLDGLPDVFPNEEHMDPEEKKHHQWEHSLLSAASLAFLRSLPRRIDTVIEGVRISVMHYAMDGCGRYTRFTPQPSPDDLRAMFTGTASDLILYGHDHRRTISLGRQNYVNAGSLGCPSREGVARAAVVCLRDGNIAVQPIDVPYDVPSVLRRIDSLGYPAANDIKTFFYGA